MNEKIYRFFLVVDAEKLLWYYQGQVKNVVVTDDLGLKIQIPLHHFKPFVQHQGLIGRFELTTSSEGKFIALKKIS